MVAPTFGATTSAGGSAGATASVALTAPTGVASGDFQLAIITKGTNSESVSAAPSGWTLAATLDNAGGGDSFETWVYYSTTDTGTATWTMSGTREWHAVRAYWENHNGGGSFDIVSTGSGTSHAITGRSVTVADSLVIGSVSLDGVAATFTPPSGWTERYDSGGQTIPITIADFTSTSTGTVNGTFTSSLGDVGNTFSMVLAATGGGGGGGLNVPVGNARSVVSGGPVASNSLRIPVTCGVV